MKDNKLIAEFMGLNTSDGVYYNHIVKEIDKHNSTLSLKKEICKSELTHFALLDYHTSWDWLMPVVEKIECTTIDNNDNSDNFFNVMIEVFECNINGGNICICENGNTKLEATHKAVVEFIKQHNKES